MIAYQKLIVYYFSGTGNSKNVALWLQEIAREKNMGSRLINIAAIDRITIDAPTADELVVFVSPVHGFNYPPVMMNFILRFPKGNNNVLLLNTRAGMLIGRYITPGMSGISLYFAAIILKTKGYVIKALHPVDMPSNWISVHPGLNYKTVKYLHDKNKEKVTAFARKVFNGKSDFKAVREIVQDFVVLPISIMYFIIGRFVFAKTFYASKDCNNCGICMKSCPVKAIKIVDNRPFWTFSCESCMQCMSNCPRKAIETAHGSLIIYSVIHSLVILVLFYKYFTSWFFSIDNEIARFFIESVLFIVLFGVWYRLTHYLLQFRWFERFVVYTSLTKYKFWGRRYKALKNI
ncbi:MAG: 4Fe-4S binding protein [Bacteroidetes bacterium]|nr:4Fe-4S binding protein [Bacteroidota bacterium]